MGARTAEAARAEEVAIEVVAKGAEGAEARAEKVRAAVMVAAVQTCESSQASGNETVPAFAIS